MLKNKIFKLEIGIAKKSQETRKDRCKPQIPILTPLKCLRITEDRDPYYEPTIVFHDSLEKTYQHYPQ